MPMMVVSSEEFELEIMRLRAPASSIVKMDKKGRNGAREIPDEIRKLIASTALAGEGTGKEIAKAFGVSQSSVEAYKNDAVSTTTYDKPNADLANHNDKVRERIRGRAQNKLALALKYITPEKLQSAKATDLSMVAANMARVVDKVTPKEPDRAVQNNIIFYSPQQVGMGNFEVIDVEAT